MTDFKQAGMNVVLRGASTMHEVLHEIVSHVFDVSVKTAIAKRQTLRLSSHSAWFQMLVFQALFAASTSQSSISWYY